jgi:uncharacterized DUF497 family protein
VHILGVVRYEWDPAKAKANLAKHRVRFADAVAVLEDNLALTMRDPFSEKRSGGSLWEEMHLAVSSSWFTPGGERVCA